MIQLESLIDDTFSVIEMMRSELLIFLIAIIAHTLVFKKHRVPPSKKVVPKHEGLNFHQSGGRSPKTPKVRDAVLSDNSSIADSQPRNERREFPRKQPEEESRSQHIQAQLRSLLKGTGHAEVDNVMRQVEGLGNADTDESLLTAVVDCCIRVGRIDFLSSWLCKNRGNFSRIKRAHTFSSMIRAYGVVKDMSGVWNTWSAMRKSHVVPTCVTLGCMVEALVSNGDPDSGYDLIHEIQAEEKEKDGR